MPSGLGFSFGLAWRPAPGMPTHIHRPNRHTQLFTRFVEIGRVVLVNYGPDCGKLATVIDVVDGNKVRCDRGGGVVVCLLRSRGARVGSRRRRLLACGVRVMGLTGPFFSPRIPLPHDDRCWWRAHQRAWRGR